MRATTVHVSNTSDSVSNAMRELTRQETALGKISNEIDFMDGAWDSEAQREYTNKFRTIKAEMDTFNQSTKEYLRTMQTFTDECVSTDLSVAAMINGISF